MFSGWGFDEIKYVHDVTGKYPAIKGFDFIQASLNDSVVKGTIEWWKAGGIPTIMWHMGAPGIGEGYENSKKEIDIDKCFEKGTPEYDSFRTELKTKADLLERLQQANIPVLWRPFHELNGNWFWWGKQGPERFVRLWRFMFDYFNGEKGLDNLIWVLGYTGQPDANWYPGAAYVDIAGADSYARTESPQLNMFNAVRNIVGNEMPVSYHECGIIPDPGLAQQQGATWSWFMTWHTDWLTANNTVAHLNAVYHHDFVITLDELPDLR